MPTESESEKSGKTGDRLKIANFIVSIFTLAALLLYAYYARKQVSETQNANSIAQAALIVANRPYITWLGFHPQRFSDPVTKVSQWRVGAAVSNVGNTPAGDVVYHDCDPIIRNGLELPNLVCNSSEGVYGDGGTVLGPKQPYFFNGQTVSDDDLVAVMTAKKSIYILGYITYRDGERFSDTEPPIRFTKFCNQITIPTNYDASLIIDGKNIYLQPQTCKLNDWNCTDGGCKTPPPEAARERESGAHNMPSVP